MSNYLPVGANPDDIVMADYEAEQEEQAWNPEDPIQDFDEDTKVTFDEE